MSSPSRRKCLRNQTRETIAKVYKFLKKDAKDILQLVSDPVCSSGPILKSKLSEHLNSVRKRTAIAVGVSERTITNILGEAKSPDSFKSPYKDRKKRAMKLELDSFNVDFIRSTIENYRLEHHELPSLLKLKRIFQEKLNYSGSISTLRRVLFKLGYKWNRKTVDNRRAIIERHDIQKL